MWYSFDPKGLVRTQTRVSLKKQQFQYGTHLTIPDFLLILNT